MPCFKALREPYKGGLGGCEAPRQYLDTSPLMCLPGLSQHEESGMLSLLICGPCLGQLGVCWVLEVAKPAFLG